MNTSATVSKSSWSAMSKKLNSKAGNTQFKSCFCLDTLRKVTLAQSNLPSAVYRNVLLCRNLRRITKIMYVKKCCEHWYIKQKYPDHHFWTIIFCSLFSSMLIYEYQCSGDNSEGGLPTLAPAVCFPRSTWGVTVNAVCWTNWISGIIQQGFCCVLIFLNA